MHLMPIYAPTADEQTNPALFAQNVQKYFCNFFNIRRSIYNFEDPKFMAFAKLNGMPRSPACLKLLKLFNKLAQYNRSRQEKERQERVEPATQSTSAAVESESSGSSTKATDHYENMAKGASISVIMENQATVQQHKRVEERRGSIGSLTSMLFAENWMQMLEIFLRRYYHILMPKFSAIDDLSSKTLSSAAELGEFLELPTMCKCHSFWNQIISNVVAIS